MQKIWFISVPYLEITKNNNTKRYSNDFVGVMYRDVNVENTVTVKVEMSIPLHPAAKGMAGRMQKDGKMPDKIKCKIKRKVEITSGF